jgi:MarR family transcriptional regulator, organic hydroperoxide resistance regulator
MVRPVRSIRPERSTPEGSGGADRERLIAAIVASFQRLTELASETHTADLIAVDITMQQAKALHVIAGDPGIGVTSLAMRLGVGPSTASGSLDRLAEMGLIERHHDAHDRRHVVLTLTDEGRAVVDRFRDVGVSIIRGYLPHLRPNELAGLQRGLDGLLRVMGAQTAAQPPIGVEGAHGTP